jgi:uncharacterized protein YbjT (DUF2867 family)
LAHQQPRTIAVTGATGFVGRHAVRALIDAGHSVRGLVRSPDKAREVLPEDGWTPVAGDVFDRPALDELTRGADAVVHTIGIRRELPGITFERLHTGATERVVEAATGGGVRRLVHVSALGVRANAPAAYFRSKHAAEQIVRRSGLDWTILRPSLIHGPDGEFIQMIKGWVLNRIAPRFFLPYFTRVEVETGFPPKPPRLESALVQPVHVDDVAEAIVRSLACEPAIGEVYPLVGPETVDWPTLLTTVRDALPMGDKKMRAIGIPAQAGLAAAVGAKHVGLAQALPFGPSEPVMASEDSTASRAKAHAHLELEPRPFVESVRAYAEQV